MIPPVHTGLPKDMSGVIMKIKDDGEYYDVFLDSGTMVTNVPIVFLRPDNVLCSGKDVRRQTARDMLTGKKYQIPTYQRRYAWQKRDWAGVWMDATEMNHTMGAISIYKHGKRLMVCDG